jgi:hypothetical protein
MERGATGRKLEGRQLRAERERMGGGGQGGSAPSRDLFFTSAVETLAYPPFRADSFLMPNPVRMIGSWLCIGIFCSTILVGIACVEELAALGPQLITCYPLPTTYYFG